MPAVQALLATASRIDAPAAHRHEVQFQVHFEAGALARATLIATAYPALGSLLLADPALLPSEAQPSAGSIARTRRALLAEPDPDAFRRSLRRFATSEKMRIALQALLPSRLGGVDPMVCARRISDLAEFLIDVALEEARRTVFLRYGEPRHADGAVGRMTVLGMGKLGGRELNAGSDVDLVCFYDSDECTAVGADGRDSSAHAVWTKVVQRMTANLDEVTADGIVWRVDLRLRPEGSRGALVNSMAAAERYYETFGRLWERGAMLRARPVAGDNALGRAFMEMLEPFIWRRRVDPEIANSMYTLVHRARVELSPEADLDLKLGPGGIREAEFFVQTLQLIWGGRDPQLRTRPTLRALARLLAAGLVTEREAHDVEQAYVALRRAEHGVQFSTGRQTHQLPAAGPERDHLARVLGFDGGNEMMRDVRGHTDRVASLFASLLPAGEVPVSPWEPAIEALDRGDEHAFAVAMDEGWRWRGSESDHERMHRELFALSRSPTSPMGPMSREQHRPMVAALLDAVLDAADPAQAATHLRSLFARVRQPAVYQKILLDDPSAMRRLITVLGGSAFVAEAIETRPDLVDLVLLSRQSVGPEDAVSEVERATAAARNDDEQDPFEAHAGALRRAKLRITTAVALADLAEEIDTSQATTTLSALADASLESALRFVLGTAEGETPRGLSILAMGKLGGREIGYGSDLDIIFLFDPASHPDDPVAHYSKCARRIISLIGTPHHAGPGYELDTRLRPSGSQGLLVASVDAFARYHQAGPGSGSPAGGAHAATWERLALLRARLAAGDPDLGKRAMAIAEEAAYEGGGDLGALARDVDRLRQRMERELACERPGRYDIKFGRGGLVDIEFSVQLLQLRHGDNPAVRSSDTRCAIAALTEAGALSLEQAITLREGYIFLRRIEQRIRVVHADDGHLLEEDAAGLSSLARRLGIHAAPQASAAKILLESYAAMRDRIRGCYDDIVLSVATP
jgi:glutamate-ammonia-ligase adenylyltransferase